MAITAIGKTELDATIPEVWANSIITAFKPYMNLAKTVSRDYEDEVANYGDTINVPVVGTLVANEKTPKEPVTRQDPSYDTKPITLDQHWEVTFSAEDVARVLSKRKPMEDYTEVAAQTLAEKVETTLSGLYTEAGLTVDAGDLTDSVTGDLIIPALREARRKLITNKIPKTTPVYGYMSEFLMEKIPLDVIDVNNLVEGFVGKVGGVNLFEAQGVATSGSPSTYHDLVYTKQAIALVVRPLPQDAETFGGARQTVIYDPETGLAIRVTMSYNADYLAPQITCDILFGFAVMFPEFLVDFYHTV